MKEKFNKKRKESNHKKGDLVVYYIVIAIKRGENYVQNGVAYG